ncbi:MAG: spore germination protein [Bacillota bacterium]
MTIHYTFKEEVDSDLKSGNLTIEKIKNIFQCYSEIKFAPVDGGPKYFTFFYCDGMIDGTQLNKFFHPIVEFITSESLDENKYLEFPPISKIETFNDVIEKIFSGYLLVYKEGEFFFYGFDISKIPQREPSESNTEVSIKGARDGFTEDINVNLSLIRKRMKSELLYNEAFVIGEISKTKVSLLYLKNKVNSESISEARNRLEKLKTESIISSGQLEQWLSDRTFSLFPLMDYTGRPDFAIECMLRGRFIILVDGSPMVLIGPNNIFETLKSPEDVYFPYHTTAFQRIFRIIGLVIAVLLPGFWIAVSSVNIDQIPFMLLNTVVTSREGLPFPAALEAFFLLGLFELLREAGVRMPKAVGQTVSIVGGLIIGDAAIRAGLASGIMIVIIALTAVSTFTLVNQSLTGTVSILRVYAMILSAFLGIYGLFLGMFSILLYLSRLESFKVSYLEPLTSLTFKEYLSALIINPFKRRDFSSEILQRGKK